MNFESYFDPDRYVNGIDPAAEYIDNRLDENADRETIRAGFVAQFADEFGSDRIDAVFEEYYSTGVQYRADCERERDAEREVEYDEARREILGDDIPF